MFVAPVKFALGLSASAVISAMALAHFHPQGRQQANAQPVVATSAAIPTQTARASIPSAGLFEHRVEADRQGQYYTTVEIDGARLRMLVDTGATSVALSYEDAAAAGIFPLPADYKYPVSTANGTAHVARVRLSHVRVGSVAVRDVEAVVGERGALSSSLLGMTFLSRLSKVETARGTLVLHQ